MSSSIGRNLGLVVALLLICVAGVVTAGDRFASVDNVLTILRLAATIGVVSIGMTFVIIGGGIDLSVGAILALCARCGAPPSPPRTWPRTSTGSSMVFAALAVGAGVRARQRPADRLRQGRALHRDPRDAGQLHAVWPRSSPSDAPRSCGVDGFIDFFGAELVGVPVIVIIFVLVAASGWVLLNRTTFGRRTLAVGGNPEAARLAGINVNRHTVMLYVLVGLCCGTRGADARLAAPRTGSSTHGTLYELDAIAAVVIGGPLLSGGRGTIVGTVFGVLIFSTLSIVFTLNNQDTSTQAVAKGLIIVVAVLLQQRLARRSTT